MAEDAHEEVSRIIERAKAGRSEPAEDLMPTLYAELREIARSCMRRERADHTLCATALVNEAYLKLADQTATTEGRAHFLSVAATAMRRILVDHARGRAAGKRGQPADRLTLSGIDPTAAGGASIDVLALDDALHQLAKLHERQARVVELRFFAGLTAEESAEVLDVSLSTIEADWRMARAWLAVRLGEV